MKEKRGSMSQTLKVTGNKDIDDDNDDDNDEVDDKIIIMIMMMKNDGNGFKLHIFPL